MLTNEYLINYFGSDLYNTGLEIYESGAVEDLDIYEASDTGLFSISTTVRVSPRRSYEISVVINPDKGWIFDSECECATYKLYHQCPHIAAVLIKYLKEYTAANTVGEHISSRPTSTGISNLLSRLEPVPYSTRSAGEIVLEPYINSDDTDEDAVHAEFRIGREDGKKYILQDITGFANCINTHECKRYGKELEFVHTISAFKEECRPLVIFLRSLANNEDTYRPQSYLYAWYRNEEAILKRTLSLKGRYLDAFMDAAQNLPLHVEKTVGYNTKVLLYHKKDGLPELTASMKQAKGGYTLHTPSIRLFKGNRFLYIFDTDRKVFYIAERSSEKLVALLDYMAHTGNNEEYISEKDLPAFSRDIYPLLTRNVKLHSDGFDPYDYLPATPKFKLFLDYPQTDRISGELKAVYPDGMEYNVFSKTDETSRRNADEESRMEAYVTEFFNSYDPGVKQLLLVGDNARMYELLREGIPELQQKIDIYISDNLKHLQIRSTPKISIGLSVSNDLLQLDLSSNTMTPHEISEILSRFDPKKKFYRLKNGDFVSLEDNGNFAEFANMADNLQLTKAQLLEGTAEVPLFRALYLNEEADETLLEINRDEKFRGLINHLKNTDVDLYKVPKNLNKTLHNYQKEGYRWLSALYDNGFGALLADEMGLGKTLQVLTFLKAHKGFGRVLVACPASLVYNWYSEIQRFTPDLPARMIQGPAEIRKEDILRSGEDEILITSYDLLKRDIETYEDMKFACEIIDEAQYIKNANTQASRAVKAINASFRIALTGTPIENRLSELWSIFDFIMPGFFLSYRRFRDTYEIPIIKDHDETVRFRLQKMITPFILRRLKKDVLKDLPDKMEEVYYANLTGMQKELYEARVQSIRLLLGKQTDKEFSRNKIEILSELTRLRQICCDPGLLYDRYNGESAKADMCVDMIRNAVEGGHKVLLFSQFTSMLDVLTARLKKEKIGYHLLVGSTPKSKRAELVESFKTDDVPVFCISLKAGGTGLNLTAADIVIHYDPWWNTAVENQATDRAHRIGQKNVVTVYRLILKDTIEERILKLQEDKAGLANRLLDDEGISSATLTRDDLLSLLD